MMDSSAMIALHTHEYGFLDVSIAWNWSKGLK
jgi:hypothetical protein